MSHCKTCKRWVPYASAADDWGGRLERYVGTGQYRAGHVGPVSRGDAVVVRRKLGLCQAVTRHGDEIAAVLEGVLGRAELRTSPDFGCVMHEPMETSSQ